MDFEAVVDELYGLPLKEFTAARKERAKAARAEGNPELSAVIQALDKPTVAAWLTNQLVRVHREEVDALLELGADLREVMADLSGDELRELTRQRHQLVLLLSSKPAPSDALSASPSAKGSHHQFGRRSRQHCQTVRAPTTSRRAVSPTHYECRASVTVKPRCHHRGNRLRGGLVSAVRVPTRR
ncbi:MAG: hypothetical protein WKF73_11155 [Nocardioidaceae bacterium]